MDVGARSKSCERSRDVNDPVACVGALAGSEWRIVILSAVSLAERFTRGTECEVRVEPKGSGPR